jgi:hypothetical protein
MKRIATVLLASALLALTVVPVWAQCNVGGNNETSESYVGPVWAVNAAPSAGSVPVGLSGNDIIISEVAYSGNNQEFIELYNPTPLSIDLSKYYVTDDFFTASGYYNIVTGAAYAIGTTTDYNVGFPAGTAPMAPGEVIVIVAGAAAGGAFVHPIVAGTRVFQLTSPPLAGYTSMVPFGNTPSPNNGLMTNGGEFVMLYRWEGHCDLVCDVDYVAWGANGSASNPRVDKTTRSADGPDPDALATNYLGDTSDAAQGPGLTHVAGQSLARAGVGIHALNGNGCNNAPTPTRGATWGELKVRYR